MREPQHAQINISRIPVSGGIGAGLAIVALLGAMAFELPRLLSVAIWGGLAGLLLAGALIWWRSPRGPRLRTRSGVYVGLAVISAAPLLAWQAKDAEADRTELLRLETVWNAAHVAGDAAALDRLWADTLAVSVPGMPLMDKAASVAMTKNTRMRFERYDTSDIRVTLYGDSAVVTGRVKRSRTMGDRRAEDDWLFTKTYVRQNARWVVAAWHASPAP